MSEVRAVEVRHEGRIHRADSMETLLSWAREHRLSREDHYREAGTDQWLPVISHEGLDRLLDPENWWTLKMGGCEYVAPDWETVVRWTREGRLTEDVQIEGPKTPPGGILGKASPELAPYLRECEPEEPEIIPPRLMFDGRTYLPGDLDTIRTWITESRVPLEAMISIDNGQWQPVTGCGHFEEGLWPTEALEAQSDAEKAPEVEGAGQQEDTRSETAEAVDVEVTSKENPLSIEEEDVDGDPDTLNADEEDPSEPYRITTTFGEDYVLRQAREVSSLLRRKKIHSFDEVRHPSLPEGTMFVNEFIEVMDLRKGSGALLYTLGSIFVVGGAALFLLRGTTQWMMYGGIAAAAVGLGLFLWGVFKH